MTFKPDTLHRKPENEQNRFGNEGVRHRPS